MEEGNNKLNAVDPRDILANHDNDMCAAGQWLLDVARASLLFQLDVNECIWGLFGSITSDTEDCDWGTYYINQPIWDA